jgi:hypothetical protein
MVALLAGCSAPANRGRVTRTAKKESSRLAAPSQRLSSFGNFELKPMELSAEISQRKEKAKVAKELEDKLRARLLPLIEQWNTDGSIAQTAGTLLIQPKLLALRVVSAGARFVTGGASGPSIINMNLELIDSRTGTVIANPLINRTAVPSASLRSSDKAQLDYLVEIAYQYLVDNYKK